MEAQKVICKSDSQLTVGHIKDLGVKSITTSVEHPQKNRQVECANKVILGQLKRRRGNAKGLWTEKLLEILWAYKSTPQTTIGENPFNLIYGTDTRYQLKLMNQLCEDK